MRKGHRLRLASPTLPEHRPTPARMRAPISRPLAAVPDPVPGGIPTRLPDDAEARAQSDALLAMMPALESLTVRLHTGAVVTYGRGWAAEG